MACSERVTMVYKKPTAMHFYGFFIKSACLFGVGFFFFFNIYLTFRAGLPCKPFISLDSADLARTILMPVLPETS